MGPGCTRQGVATFGLHQVPGVSTHGGVVSVLDSCAPAKQGKQAPKAGTKAQDLCQQQVLQDVEALRNMRSSSYTVKKVFLYLCTCVRFTSIQRKFLPETFFSGKYAPWHDKEGSWL